MISRSRGWAKERGTEEDGGGGVGEEGSVILEVKKETKGLQKPVNCIAKASFKSRVSLGLQSYLFSSMLVFNTVNQAFYDLKELQK